MDPSFETGYGDCPSPGEAFPSGWQNRVPASYPATLSPMRLHPLQEAGCGYLCIWPKPLMELSQAYHLRILNDLLKDNMKQQAEVRPRKAADEVS